MRVTGLGVVLQAPHHTVPAPLPQVETLRIDYPSGIAERRASQGVLVAGALLLAMTLITDVLFFLHL